MQHFLGPLDWFFIILYLAVIAGVSVWSIRKSKETPGDYFLANRNLGWFVIGADGRLQDLPHPPERLNGERWPR